jgi:ABC-type multidrug transport system ATPase subunit
MEIFSDIKGIRSDYKDEIIDMTLAEMDLTQYANVFAGKLSGGNKRKL